ncbi:Tnks, partial [Symbiodinium sp. CCMP2456]
IELRQAGYVEVNGADSNGIFDKLCKWLEQTWKAKRVQADPGYCALKFSCDVFSKRGREGENNMGMRTMEMVDFMVQQCAWTMITCNGGNFGRYGDIREQQMVFRDDGHVQHGDDHIMVELRDIGYVEVNGLSSSRDIEPFVSQFLMGSWQCQDYNPHFYEQTKFCDRKFVTPQNLYYKQGLTNNIGKLTIELSIALASQGWMLMLCNGGHISSIKDPAYCNSMAPLPMRKKMVDCELIGGIKREQQIKFSRAPDRAIAAEPLLMIELRSVPRRPPESINTMNLEYIDPFKENETRKRQTAVALRDWIVSADYEGFVEVNGFNTNGVYQKLQEFIERFLKGRLLGPQPYCDCLFSCSAFRQKMSPHGEYWDGFYCGENNFGKYTMRLIDFLVDHLGEWDLIACNGNAAERAWSWSGLVSMVAREQQLVFRHRPKAGRVFMATGQYAPLGHKPMQAPDYWTTESREGTAAFKVVPVTEEEKEWLQQLLDGSYVKRVTRDRRGGRLAERFELVAAVRSENPHLWDAFANRRHKVGLARDGLHADHRGEDVVPKTTLACPALAARCVDEDGKNPSTEGMFLHGTNPTSAVAILKNNFKIDLAGASAGTMFGPGAYLAEASTKADEYAQDDKAGSYKGLYAMVACRAVMGRPFVEKNPGNYSKKVTSGAFDVVLGDREAAVGTFREFIFFHEESIYPEYALFYRRVHGEEVSETVLEEVGCEPKDVEPGIPEAIPGCHGQLQCLVPADAIPGGTLKVRTPGSDQVIEIALPEAVRPGSILAFRVRP